MARAGSILVCAGCNRNDGESEGRALLVRAQAQARSKGENDPPVQVDMMSHANFPEHPGRFVNVRSVFVETLNCVRACTICTLASLAGPAYLQPTSKTILHSYFLL
jgi:hypothetical protein